jgi:hypothetical protein
MAERDDQDLAIEQLASAGHADDRQLTLRHAPGPVQEHAAVAAEPAVADISRERLTAIRERLERLTAQRDASPISQLHRLDELDTQLIGVATARARCEEALEKIPPPPRRLLGRAPDPHFVDRHRLQSQITAAEDQLNRLTQQRATLARELGDPQQARSELDGFDDAIAALTEQHRSLRHQLGEQELAKPAPWATRTLGERPANHRAQDWDHAVLRIADYRLDHAVSDPQLPLGPRPAGERERREWQRAQQAIEHARQLLGRERDHTPELEIGF